MYDLLRPDSLAPVLWTHSITLIDKLLPASKNRPSGTTSAAGIPASVEAPATSIAHDAPGDITSSSEDDDDDPLSFFADSLLPLFDEVIPAHGTPSTLFTYKPPPGSANLSPLTVRIPPQEGSTNNLYAHYLWRSALRLGNLIGTGTIGVHGKTVCELGAGAGLPGLLAAREGAASVTLSDYDSPALISNLRHNVSLLPPALQPAVSVVGNTWGEPWPSSSPNQFDLIFLADTLWMSSSHDVLITTLQTLLSKTDPTAEIVVVAGLHSGRFTIRSFLNKAELAGFEIVGDWREVSFEDEERKWGWDLDAGWEEELPSSERNRWSVEGRLRWKRS